MEMGDIKFTGNTYTWANNREGEGLYKRGWTDFVDHLTGCFNMKLQQSDTFSGKLLITLYLFWMSTLEGQKQELGLFLSQGGLMNQKVKRDSKRFGKDQL